MEKVNENNLYVVETLENFNDDLCIIFAEYGTRNYYYQFVINEKKKKIELMEIDVNVFVYKLTNRGFHF